MNDETGGQRAVPQRLANKPAKSKSQLTSVSSG